MEMEFVLIIWEIIYVYVNMDGKGFNVKKI